MTLLRRTPLRRTGRIRRKAHKDPVTPPLRLHVIARDEGRCQAPIIASANEQPITSCTDRWGRPAVMYVTIDGPVYTTDSLTLQHVKDAPRIGKRAPSDERHLLTLCWGHHLGGWADIHLPEQREHLRTLYGGPTDAP